MSKVFSVPVGRHEPYFRFVREERHFCAVLAHLLMQRGENLRKLLVLISEQADSTCFPSRADLNMMSLDDAEVYLEYSFLRDRWSQIASNQKRSQNACNDTKRAFIFELLSRVPSLASLQTEQFSPDVARFNEKFMGPKGLKVMQDIASPALWSVQALHDLAFSLTSVGAQQKQLFRDLCKFKWAFLIKPDMVIVLPGREQRICIEAKVMSPQGHYPANGEEAKLFDRHFDSGKRRVGQIELQDFMFRVLLQWSAQHALISRSRGSMKVPDSDREIPVLSWRQVFDRLDSSSSMTSVRGFIHGNECIEEEAPVEFSSGPNHDGTVHGLEELQRLIEQRRQEGLRTEVGFSGGRAKLEQQTLDSLVGRRWKWRNPDLNTGKVLPKNWINAEDFERIVEQLRAPNNTQV
jgi:hypothetical protein